MWPRPWASITWPPSCWPLQAGILCGPGRHTLCGQVVFGVSPELPIPGFDQCPFADHHWRHGQYPGRPCRRLGPRRAAGTPPRICRIPLPGVWRGLGRDDVDRPEGLIPEADANLSCTRKKRAGDRRTSPRAGRHGLGEELSHGSPRSQESHQAIWRPASPEQHRPGSQGEEHPQRHWPQWRRQDHLLQLRDRFLHPRGRRDPAQWTQYYWTLPGPRHQARRVPYLPEYPALQEHDGRGEHPCWHAPPSQVGVDRRHPARSGAR